MAIAKQDKLYLVSFGFFLTQEIEMLMRTQFCVQKFTMFLNVRAATANYLLWVMFGKQSRIAIQRFRLQRDATLLLKQKHRNKHNQKTKKKETLLLLFLSLNCTVSLTNL